MLAESSRGSRVAGTGITQDLEITSQLYTTVSNADAYLSIDRCRSLGSSNLPPFVFATAYTEVVAGANQVPGTSYSWSNHYHLILLVNE
jgi:hypothetical protein